MNEDTKKEIKKIVDKEKGFRAQEVVILVLITCVFSFFAGNAFSRVKAENDVQKPTEFSEELNTFITNYQHIVSSYYQELDEAVLLNEALKAVTGMLEDPYSIYMDEETYNSLNITLEGSYKGLGLSVYQEKVGSEIIVSGVFDSSPAAKAGIVSGDVIVSVNDIKTTTITTTEFSQMVLNSAGNEFKLVIKSNGKEKTVTLRKENIVIPSVDSEVFEVDGQKIGYIYISIFANNTFKQFQTELASLDALKIDSLIIDVRGNTGGHLTAVARIIELFIDKTHIAYQMEQNGIKTPTYSKGAKTKTYPIIFLADGYSASASEVLIASLKENLGATVIGEKTYGKGTVQELVTLANGDKYKLTTKKWLTPKGLWIEDTKGIIPDIELELSKDVKYYTDDNDNQLQRAIEELTKNITKQ